MGLSTFIEINNDLTNEIENNPDGFIATLITYLHCGQKDIHIPAVTKKITLHRDDEKCIEIHSLLNRHC